MLLGASSARAQEVVLRNCDVLRPAFDVDYSVPSVLTPVRIVGTRNGTFSGKVVLASREPIKGVTARVSDLVGPGKIPTSAVRVRYALFDAPSQHLACAFDALSDTPPDESPVTTTRMFGRLWQAQSPAMGWALQPVWVTVNVPKDARPGDYAGSLTVTAAEAKRLVVPVQLHVSGWTLPEPVEWRTFVEVIQSPESVAMFYDVPLWSDEHFRLIGRSLELTGRLGCKTVYLPLIGETNLGNAESMVRWARRGDGSYTHDFSVVERYLDLVAKHQGKPTVVCLYVWDVFLEGGRAGLDQAPEVRDARAAEEGKGAPVTAVDPRTKKVETVRLVQYSDCAASRPLWKPLADGLLDRMKRRGLGKSLVLGVVTDALPAKPVVELFTELCPGVPWMRRGHMRITDVHGVTLALQEGPSYNAWAYNLKPGTSSLHGWQGVKWRYPGLSVHFPRALWDYHSRCAWRMLGEVNIAGSQRGFGGLGADFWHVLRDSRGNRRGRITEGRFPKSSWRNLTIRTALLWAAPGGPEATVRFEMMREGLQECEARIRVEEALLKKSLPDADARGPEELLDERTRALIQGMGDKWAYHSHWETQKVEYDVFIDGGWQERSRKLFDAAAEAQKRR